MKGEARRGEARRGEARKGEERSGAERGRVERGREERRAYGRVPVWKQSFNTMLEDPTPLPSPSPFIILKPQTGCDALPLQLP